MILILISGDKKMGCDIHFFVEKKMPGGWAFVDKLEREDTDEGGIHLSVDYHASFFDTRSYDTFSILADVRNGYGFAGVSTGAGFVPIVPLRGLPTDCSEEYNIFVKQWEYDGHSHSYLSVRELLDYDWTRVTTKRGWLTLEEFEQWVQWGEPNGEQPKSWCGGISGGGIKKLSREEGDTLLATIRKSETEKDFDACIQNQGDVYVDCVWTVPYYQAASSFVGRTLPRLLALCEGDYDSVRCVFFFDN